MAKDSLNYSNNRLLSKLVMVLSDLRRMNRVFASINADNSVSFLEKLFSTLEISLDIPEEDLKKIPASGRFITISNQPFGGIETLVLLYLMLKRNADYKVMSISGQLYEGTEYLRDLIIPIQTGNRRRSLSEATLKKAWNHLSNGGSLGLFPAIEVSGYQMTESYVEDWTWNQSVVKMIRNANVPIVPIFFQGSNSLLRNILSSALPSLRTVPIPANVIKKNRTLRLRIGSPIKPEVQNEFATLPQFSRFLRAKTYLLGSSIKVSSSLFNKPKKVNDQPEKVVDAIPTELLIQDIAAFSDKNLLFKMQNYCVYSAKSTEIPHILPEIGRLRELTFRAVGEGTNQATDMDEYDLHYCHLFIWDEVESRVVGAYRIGKGRDIINRFGVQGFYISTLFKFDKEMLPILSQSLELGRSFVVQDYQRKPLPLFLLWKGLLYQLLTDAEYRYMIGPVSISGRYSEVSKDLIMRFIRANHFDNRIAAWVHSRSKYRVCPQSGVQEMLNATKDISQLDKAVSDLEATSDKLPVLLKKYISLNAKIVGFNVDPLFNMCLDGLLILDAFDVPMKTIEGLSKELADSSMLARFNKENVCQ